MKFDQIYRACAKKRCSKLRSTKTSTSISGDAPPRNERTMTGPCENKHTGFRAGRSPEDFGGKCWNIDWNPHLVGGWTNPFEKYEWNWKSFPNIEVKIEKYLKPPPSHWFCWWKKNMWGQKIADIENGWSSGARCLMDFCPIGSPLSLNPLALLICKFCVLRMSWNLDLVRNHPYCGKPF